MSQEVLRHFVGAEHRPSSGDHPVSRMRPAGPSCITDSYKIKYDRAKGRIETTTLYELTDLDRSLDQPLGLSHKRCNWFFSCE